MIAIHRESGPIALPGARVPISIRVGTMADLAWIDALQKLHNKMLGFMPLGQLKGYVEAGNVLVAESGGGECGRPARTESDGAIHMPAGGTPALPDPLGYIIARDKYFKRDDCGIIYQLNVAPGSQRGLIGASLVKAVFERAAYGCKLFCCWCAQDIEANYFWESIGFVPLAFRTGSRERGSDKQPRIHIFWQRRINQEERSLPGETPGVPAPTPYWFPAETSGGALRENRIVLPIPPGIHWSEVRTAILPQCQRADAEEGVPPLPLQPQPREKRERKAKGTPKVVRPAGRPAGGLWFAPPSPGAGAPSPLTPLPRGEGKNKPRVKLKNDPKYVAAARELRDRYLEEMNSGRLLPAREAKYDVSRQLAAGVAPKRLLTGAPGSPVPLPLLKAA